MNDGKVMEIIASSVQELWLINNAGLPNSRVFGKNLQIK